MFVLKDGGSEVGEPDLGVEENPMLRRLCRCRVMSTNEEDVLWLEVSVDEADAM